MVKTSPTKKRIPVNAFLIAFGIYGGVGIQLAVAVVGGILLGGYLDRRWDTAPVLFFTGTILGSVVGFYNLIRVLNWKQNRKKTKS